MILFVNKSNFLKWKINIMTFNMAYGIIEAVLHFSMQGEDVIEHTHVKCHVLHFCMQEEDILEHTNAKCHLRTL